MQNAYLDKRIFSAAIHLSSWSPRQGCTQLPVAEGATAMRLHAGILAAATFLTSLAVFAGGLADGDLVSSPRGANQASQCRVAADCPLFDEVYAATPSFRHALALALRHGNASVPEWVKDKLNSQGKPRDAAAPMTASNMLPLRVDEQPYVLGRMADPENSAHAISALYDIRRGFISVYYVNREGHSLLLGDTTEILQRVVIDFVNAGSAFSQALREPDVALPIPIRSR